MSIIVIFIVVLTMSRRSDRRNLKYLIVNDVPTLLKRYTGSSTYKRNSSITSEYILKYLQ